MSEDERDALAEAWATPRVERPTQCIHCPGRRIWWNGTRKRSASVRVGDRAEHLRSVVCRRVKCADCVQSWTLRPPGLLPHKHIQPDVVAATMSTYLFDERATRASVAQAVEVSERTIGRWTEWVSALATPQQLLSRLLVATDAPVVPVVPEVAAAARKARSPERIALLARAAVILVLLESLACARGLEPPGLRSVLEREIAQRSGVCTYAHPTLFDEPSARPDALPEGAS